MPDNQVETHILVVFTTTIGNTARMAEAIAEGARSVDGCNVVLKSAEEATLDDARQCDGLILGSPIRHRSADARIKVFIERVLEQLWLTDEMVGKVGGVFTVGGGYGNAGAGCDVTQVGMLASLAGCGMILVPFPKTSPGSDVAGSHWGPNGRSGGSCMEPDGVTDAMLQAAWHHGASVARVAVQMKGIPWFATGNKAPSDELIAMFSQSE
jgi:NAD(P)H dehydrogenase (quinone)